MYAIICAFVSGSAFGNVRSSAGVIVESLLVFYAVKLTFELFRDYLIEQITVRL
jgi:hypothetical protein